jgi:methylase of polypeptide subunit release factors
MLDKQKIEQLRQQLKTGVRTVAAPQLFPTPPDLARRMVEMANIQPANTILEPSAGTGRILDALADYWMFCPITAFELNVDLAQSLQRSYGYVIVWQGDFLERTDMTFDRIVMNPPFVNGADIRHIRHAVSLLRPGGRVVALCADGPRQRKAFENHYSEALPPGLFSDEGTNVNTRLVIIDKA